MGFAQQEARLDGAKLARSRLIAGFYSLNLDQQKLFLDHLRKHADPETVDALRLYIEVGTDPEP
jgi:hypothetical protein